MRTGRPFTGRRGTTMIEVLIAAAILSIGLLAVVGLRAACARHVTVSEHHLEAQLLARQVVSQLVSRPYDKLLDAMTLASDSPDLHPVEIPAGFGGDYTVTVESADSAPEAATPRLLKITVTVAWTSGGPSSGLRTPAGFKLERLVTSPEYGFVQRLAIPDVRPAA